MQEVFILKPWGQAESGSETCWRGRDPRGSSSAYGESAGHSRDRQLRAQAQQAPWLGICGTRGSCWRQNELQYRCGLLGLNPVHLLSGAEEHRRIHVCSHEVGSSNSAGYSCQWQPEKSVEMVRSSSMSCHSNGDLEESGSSFFPWAGGSILAALLAWY